MHRKYPVMNKLKGFIYAQGMTYEKVSILLEIPRTNFYRKLNGFSSFNAEEIRKMKNLFNMTNDEIVDYFILKEE